MKACKHKLPGLYTPASCHIIHLHPLRARQHLQFPVNLLSPARRGKNQAVRRDARLLLQKPDNPIHVIRIAVADKDKIKMAHALAFQEGDKTVFPDGFVLAAPAV